jgi:hypothetical protein
MSNVARTSAATVTTCAEESRGPRGLAGTPRLRALGRSALALVPALTIAAACASSDEPGSLHDQDRNLGDGTVLYKGHQYGLCPHTTSGARTCVVAPGGGYATATPVATASFTGVASTASTWQFEDLDATTDRIINTSNGLCLEADTKNKRVVMSSCGQSIAQKWVVTNNKSDGVSFSYQIKSQLNDNIFAHGGCIQYGNANRAVNLTLGTCGTTSDRSQLFDIVDGVTAPTPASPRGFRLLSISSYQHVQIGNGSLVPLAGWPTQVLHFGSIDNADGSFRLTTTTAGHVLSQRYLLSAPSPDGSRALLVAPLASAGSQKCVEMTGASLSNQDCATWQPAQRFLILDAAHKVRLSAHPPAVDSVTSSSDVTVTSDGQALTVSAGSLANGTKIVQHGVTTSEAGTSPDTRRYWQFTAEDNTVPTYALHRQGTGSCIDVPNFSSLAGVALQQYSCAHTGNQRWRFLNVDSDPATLPSKYLIVNQQSNMCLSAGSKDASDNDHSAVQEPCDLTRSAQLYTVDYEFACQGC